MLYIKLLKGGCKLDGLTQACRKVRGVSPGLVEHVKTDLRLLFVHVKL